MSRAVEALQSIRLALQAHDDRTYAAWQSLTSAITLAERELRDATDEAVNTLASELGIELDGGNG